MLWHLPRVLFLHFGHLSTMEWLVFTPFSIDGPSFMLSIVAVICFYSNIIDISVLIDLALFLQLHSCSYGLLVVPLPYVPMHQSTDSASPSSYWCKPYSSLLSFGTSYFTFTFSWKCFLAFIAVLSIHTQQEQFNKINQYYFGNFNSNNYCCHIYSIALPPNLPPHQQSITGINLIQFACGPP